MNKRLLPTALSCVASILALTAPIAPWAAESIHRRIDQPSLAFRPAADGGYEFDTGLLKGRIRAGGKSLGLTEVVHTRSGLRLDRSNGLFSHYRVFTKGVRHGGGAWDWPSSAALIEGGAIAVSWPAATNRPFSLKAVYRWSSPDTLDLVTTVRAEAPLQGFETFLASYFSEPFTNAFVCSRPTFGSGTQPALMAASRSLGEWLMFPRDEACVSLITDGRWALPPNPVSWVVLSPYAEPLAIRRAPEQGINLLVLARPTDCMGLAMPHETESHRSVYLSLFGRNLETGGIARARACLVLSPSGSAEQSIQHGLSALDRIR